MSKAVVALLLLVLTSFEGLEAQTIDCTQAFTRLEHAICSNPRLEELEAELSGLAEQAVASRFISKPAVRAMRDLLALRCSAADEVDTCLVEHTGLAIVQLSLETGAIVEIPASHHPGRGRAGFHAELQTEFQNATEHYRVTGSAGALAQATFKLLDYYGDDGAKFLPAEVRSYEIAALEATVARGCGNLEKRREWQRVIQARGRSCDNALYALRTD